MSVVVEDKLMDLFGLIPERTYMQSGLPYTTPKPVYHFGDAKECNLFIVKMSGLGMGAFPIIFQTSNEETQNNLSNSVTTTIELVIATDTSAQLSNDERWATTYRNILMPLVDDVFKAINESGIVRWNQEYTLIKFPNYSNTTAKDQNAFVSIVDAVLFRANITISGKGCYNKTIFN